MNNSKKILRVLWFFILFIPAYFAVYNIYVISSDKFTVENITKIEVTGIDGQICAEYTGGDDIKLYIKTLDNAEKSKITDTANNRQLKYEQPFILTFYKGEKQFAYGMYLSLASNDCIIMNSDGELFHMDEKDAKRILNTTLADALYRNNKLPVASLIYQGEDPASIYPSEGEWNLKKPDGKFYPSTVPNLIAASNKAKAFQSKPFDVRFSVEPDILYIDVKDGKEIIFSDVYSKFLESFSYDAANDLQYVLTAEWHEKETEDYYGGATYIIDVKYYVPAKFEISQTEAEPGDIVAITAYNMSEDENLTLTTDMGYETKFVSSGTNRVALIPISSDFVGKTFSLTLTSDVNEPVDYFLKINGKEAGTPFNMGAQDSYVNTHLSSAAQSDKQARYDEIFAVLTGENEKYWTDKFAMPKSGDIVLDYGRALTVNMGSAHINNGIYISSEKGDPVKASNAGKVIFTGTIPYDGNLIVIDHGMGIKTWYGHLDTIDVKMGDGVLKGQQIGTSGVTGMYTTQLANLYFAVSIRNIFVDPLKAVKDGIPGVDTASEGYNNLTTDSGSGNTAADIPEAAADNSGGDEKDSAGN